MFCRFKHLPCGKPLSGDHLKEDLHNLAKSYISRADRLLNLGSTQANESFNNSVASFAPKNRSVINGLILLQKSFFLKGGGAAQSNIPCYIEVIQLYLILCILYMYFDILIVNVPSIKQY